MTTPTDLLFSIKAAMSGFGLVDRAALDVFVSRSIFLCAKEETKRDEAVEKLIGEIQDLRALVKGEGGEICVYSPIHGEVIKTNLSESLGELKMPPGEDDAGHLAALMGFAFYLHQQAAVPSETQCVSDMVEQFGRCLCKVKCTEVPVLAEDVIRLFSDLIGQTIEAHPDARPAFFRAFHDRAGVSPVLPSGPKSNPKSVTARDACEHWIHAQLNCAPII